MLERTKARALPVLGNAAEHAPMATVCCNACRTCVSTNLIGLATAGAAGLAVGIRRLLGRVIAKPSVRRSGSHSPQ